MSEDYKRGLLDAARMVNERAKYRTGLAHEHLEKGEYSSCTEAAAAGQALFDAAAAIAERAGIKVPNGNAS